MLSRKRSQRLDWIRQTLKREGEKKKEEGKRKERKGGREEKEQKGEEGKPGEG